MTAAMNLTFGFGEGLFFVIGGGLLMAAFWIAVIYVGVRLARGDAGPSRHRSTALEILEDRYARGEITRDEYLERKDVLTGGT
jgi:putative membrane protein